MTLVKRRKVWRMSSAQEAVYSSAHSPTFSSLHLRHSSLSNLSVTSPTHHSSFSNPSVASPTSELILQPFFRFSCVTGSSFTSPGEPPMISRWSPFSIFISCFSKFVIQHRTNKCLFNLWSGDGRQFCSCTVFSYYMFTVI